MTALFAIEDDNLHQGYVNLAAARYDEERVIRTADCPVLTIRTRGVVARATKAGKSSKAGKTAAKQIAQPTATKKAKKKPPAATKKATQVAAKRPSAKKRPK